MYRFIKSNSVSCHHGDSKLQTLSRICNDNSISKLCYDLICAAVCTVQLHDDSYTVFRVEYFDEASRDLGSSVDDTVPQNEPTSFSIKNIHINGGVSLYTDVFSPCHRNNVMSQAAAGAMSASQESSMSSTMASDIFVSVYMMLVSECLKLLYLEMNMETGEILLREKR